MSDKVTLNCKTGELVREPLSQQELDHRARDTTEFDRLNQAARAEADLRDLVVTKLAAVIGLPVGDVRRALKLGGHSEDPLVDDRGPNSPRVKG